MANGDAAAAAGLRVWASTQDIRQGYDNDNVLGDEIAAVMARAKVLETYMAGPTVVQSAAATGATIGAGGGTLGVTAGLAVTAVPYKRVIEIDAAALVTGLGAGANASPYADVILRKDGAAVRSWRVYSAGSGGGRYSDTLAANAATTYQVVVSSPKASAVTDNGTFTYLTATIPTVAS